jgi:hypothetical protein
VTIPVRGYFGKAVGQTARKVALAIPARHGIGEDAQDLAEKFSVEGEAVALALFALGTVEMPAAGDQRSTLTIDPCVRVDEATVRQLMELELRGTRSLPASVTVRCIDGAQEIRVQPRVAPDREEVRTIQLVYLVDEDAPAARQARSRELALAIAELVRSQDSGPAPPPELAPPPEPPASPPPAAASLAAASAPAKVRRPERRWQLGILSTVDYFSGGQKLSGGDLFLAARAGRWFLAELRLGGRLGIGDEPLPGGHLTARAGAAAVAVGGGLWTTKRTLGTAFVLRGQGYLVQFRAEGTSVPEARTALLGAVVLAAEPRLMVAVGQWLYLEAAAAVGLLPRGIAVRIQGAESRSLSGVFVSGNLGGGTGVLTERSRTSRFWKAPRARDGVRARRCAIGCLAVVCLGSGACSNTTLDLGFRDAAAFVNPDPGLLAHWAFDESQPGATVVDSSGFGNDGKPSANPPGPVTDVPPVHFKNPSSYSFSGQDQWIELGNPPLLNIGGPITLAAWIRPLASDSDRNVIAHGYRWDIPHDFALRIHEGVYRFTTWDSSDHAADAAMDPSRWTRGFTCAASSTARRTISMSMARWQDPGPTPPRHPRTSTTSGPSVLALRKATTPPSTTSLRDRSTTSASTAGP